MCSHNHFSNVHTWVVCGLNTSSSIAPRVFLKPLIGAEVRDGADLGAVTVKLPSLESEDTIESGLTPEGSENRCSNCLETKLPPVSVWVSCLAKITRTSPSVLTLNSSGCKEKDASSVISLFVQFVASSHAKSWWLYFLKENTSTCTLRLRSLWPLATVWCEL